MTSPKTHWEYTYLLFAYADDAMDIMLNQYTDKGWEVINFSEYISDTGLSGRIKAWLRRELK